MAAKKKNRKKNPPPPPPAPRQENPFGSMFSELPLDLVVGVGRKILGEAAKVAVSGAADALLERLQQHVHAFDGRIDRARSKAQAGTRVVDVEVVDEERSH